MKRREQSKGGGNGYFINESVIAAAITGNRVQEYEKKERKDYEIHKESSLLYVCDACRVAVDILRGYGI